MIKKYVSVYASGYTYSPGGKKRRFFVDYEEIDTLKREFVKTKQLRVFSNPDKANDYTKKKAKQLKAERTLWTGKEPAIITPKIEIL